MPALKRVFGTPLGRKLIRKYPPIANPKTPIITNIKPAKDSVAGLIFVIIGT